MEHADIELENHGKVLFHPLSHKGLILKQLTRMLKKQNKTAKPLRLCALKGRTSYWLNFLLSLGCIVFCIDTINF